MRILLLSLALTLFAASCEDPNPATATEAAPPQKSEAVAADTKKAEVAVPEISVEDADKALPHARGAYEKARRWGAQRVATEAVVYGMAAALCDAGELEGIAEQALYSARRYDIEGAHLLAQALQGSTAERTSSLRFLEAMRYALDTDATIQS